jgi:hypothetical protein
MPLGILSVAGLAALNLVGYRLARIVIPRHATDILRHFIACNVFLCGDETVGLGYEANTGRPIILMPSEFGDKWEHRLSLGLICFFLLFLSILVYLQQIFLYVFCV